MNGGRIEVHNSEVDSAIAEQHLCGMTHLATGQVCMLAERHSGGCDFEPRTMTLLATDDQGNDVTVLAPLKARQALRRAAVRATRAPSVHNTQPWRFVLRSRSLEIHADLSRLLRFIDPDARELMISCGCALFNARVALAAAGFAPRIEVFPDEFSPNLLARLTLDEPAVESLRTTEFALMDGLINERRTNRRAFSDEVVPDALITQLVAAAATEHASLIPVTRPQDRISLAVLSQRANDEEILDPAYRAELRAWTHDEPAREDGVAAMSVPHIGAGSRDEVPIRDFDTRGAGALPTETASGLSQSMVILGTRADTPTAWLQAGQALEHLLLLIAQAGYAVSPITQVFEVATTRALLRQELRLAVQPHLLLRIGRAEPTPATRRRRLADMLVDHG